MQHNASKQDTILVHVGRRPHDHQGMVNPPVYHASTILFPTLDALDGRDPNTRYTYARRGTPTSAALEEAVCALEHAAGTILTPSGMSALSTAILACVRAGDHILVTDALYAPVRHWLDRMLSRLGVAITYYDPAIAPAALERLITDRTRMITMESPGSLTFEMQDIRAIVAVAQARGIATLIDNTWSSGYFLKPLTLGVDISIQAATKYIGGHSDLMMGVIACSARALPWVRDAATLLGLCVAPDDVFLALRGLRSMGTRLRQHHANGLAIARWLQGRPEVLRVLHPALPDDPGHALWTRDFTGASSLFGFVLRPAPRSALAAMMNAMRLFGMGYSWGGFESLLLPTDPAASRSATVWNPGGQTMRIHIGLEDPEDLIADLEDGLARLTTAAGHP